MKNGHFEKTDREWEVFADFYRIVEKFYSQKNYDDMIHQLNTFMKKYGVQKVTEPQTDPVAALAHRLAIALADLAEDLRRADK